MPSCAKNFAHRKFELVYRSEKHKTLRLECETTKERNDWYEALKRTITAARVRYMEAWSRSESLSRTKWTDYPDNVSDEDSKELESSGVIRDEGDESSKVEPSERLQDPYNNRYAVTSSFRIQEFKEIDPMDDNISQASEQDVAFNQEHKEYLAEDGMTGSRCLSPFEKVGSNHSRRTSDSVVVMQSPNGSDLLITAGSVVLAPNSPSARQSENKEDGFNFFDQGKRSSIVRRSGKQSTSPSKSPSQRLTIRLDGF